MTLFIGKSLHLCCLFFLAGCALWHSPAWGATKTEGVKGEAGTSPIVAVGKADDIDQLIADARAGVKEDPSDARALIRLGGLLVRKGALDEALLSFDKALAITPHAHDAKTGRGIVFSRKGELRKAEQALQEALRLNPNPVRTHYELGLVYERLGDLEKALSEFKAGIHKYEQGR